MRSLKSILVIAAVALLSFATVAGARSGDRNRDRLPDRWEKAHHLSLKVKQTYRDQDKDGLKNLAEYRNGTNPRVADSDDDGLDDGDEVKTGNKPRDDDSDDDGIEDGDENAGTIKSFDKTSGVLVISLAKGGEVSGTVTPQTEVKCRSTMPTAGKSNGGDDEPDGDRNDDHGDRGDDHGDREDDDEGDDDASCGADPFTTGRAVREADLEVKNGTATWDEIKLL